MLEEVEVDLEGALPVRHDRGGEPRRGHVQGHVPGVIDEGALGETDLPDDLGPHVQGRTGVAPGLQRKLGPCAASGPVVHAFLLAACGLLEPDWEARYWVARSAIR